MNDENAPRKSGSKTTDTKPKQHASRRSFLKAGAAAGAGLIMSGETAVAPCAETDTVRTEFKTAGVDGNAVLEIDGKAPQGAVFDVTVSPLNSNSSCVRLRLKAARPLNVRRFAVTVSVPLADMHRVWYTQQIDGLGQHAYISLPWGAEIPAGGHQGSFLAAVQSRHGRNRGLIGFKNQTGDGSVHFKIEYGGTKFHMTLSRFVKDRTFAADGIDETVYIDRTDIPWQESVTDFVRWYDREHSLSYDCPPAAFEPAFNTWYPLKNEQYEQDIIRLAEQCRNLGIRTFEIDAGWFVNTGFWKPNTEKIPDLKGLVKRLQDMGLRMLIWYRPFHSGGVKELEYLCTVEDGSTPSQDLCVRTREVQERAGRLAAELMERYGLDGLKIDFLDASTVKFINCTANHDHVTDFVSDGSRAAMRLMADAVRNEKPDALIEYRLNYANVANREFAAMYRGQDAPSDPDHIRRHLALLRSWSVGVAPHADYAYWTPDLDESEVARFMAGICLYGVPTLSVDFDTLPRRHFTIAKAWLKLYNDNRDRLIHGAFETLSNDFHYSVVRISAPGTSYIPAFLEHWPAVVPVPEQSADSMFLFNGTAYPRITTMIEGASGTYEMQVLDAALEPVGGTLQATTGNRGLALDCPVPVGGSLSMTRS